MGRGGSDGHGHGGGGHAPRVTVNQRDGAMFTLEGVKGKTIEAVMQECADADKKDVKDMFRGMKGQCRMPTPMEVVRSFDMLHNPEGVQKRCWDVLIVLLVLAVCITLPLKVTVEFWHPDKEYYWYFEKPMDAIFWADMVVNFTASFVDHHGHVCHDRRHIVEHYVTEPLQGQHGLVLGRPVRQHSLRGVLDGSRQAPPEDGQGHQAREAPALRIGKLKKYLGHYVNFAMFIQHTFMTLFFLHCVACWYIGLYYKHITCEMYYPDVPAGNLNVDSHGNRAWKHNWDDHAWYDHYCSPGHRRLAGGGCTDDSGGCYDDDGHRRLAGDPACYDDHADDYHADDYHDDHADDYHADDDHRRLSGGIEGDPNCVELSVAYIEAIGSVVSMIAGGLPTVDGVNYNELERDTPHRSRIDRASHELNYFGVPHHITEKVKSAMEYQWRAMMPSRCTVFKDESLSPHLRQEIVMHFHGRELRNTALFAGCSNGCVAAAALKLNSIVVRSFDYIIRQGEVGRELFLLSRGKAAVSSNDVVVALVEEGNFFGETALVSKTSPYRTVDVVALVWCELQMLSRDDFRELCHDYPAVLANAEMMMTMLEQEPAMCDVLWSYYLRKKNDILMESIAAPLGTDELGAKAHAHHTPGGFEPPKPAKAGAVAPDSPHGHGDTGFKQKQLQAVDAATYKQKTQELYENVKNGTLRGAALKEMIAQSGATKSKTASTLDPTPEHAPPAAAGPPPAGAVAGSLANSMDHTIPETSATTDEELQVLPANDAQSYPRDVEDLLTEVVEEEGKDSAETNARASRIRASFRHSGCL
ncbi:cyclic nucleotide-gated ion channel [Aureococcus anophagefferens]|nr:cyclic nucleotide-gated ion channel [Aureococcus anophagefferens]